MAEPTSPEGFLTLLRAAMVVGCWYATRTTKYDDVGGHSLAHALGWPQGEVDLHLARVHWLQKNPHEFHYGSNYGSFGNNQPCRWVALVPAPVFEDPGHHIKLMSELGRADPKSFNGRGSGQGPGSDPRLAYFASRRLARSAAIDRVEELLDAIAAEGEGTSGGLSGLMVDAALEQDYEEVAGPVGAPPIPVAPPTAPHSPVAPPPAPQSPAAPPPSPQSPVTPPPAPLPPVPKPRRPPFGRPAAAREKRKADGESLVGDLTKHARASGAPGSRAPKAAYLMKGKDGGKEARLQVRGHFPLRPCPINPCALSLRSSPPPPPLPHARPSSQPQWWSTSPTSIRRWTLLGQRRPCYYFATGWALTTK